MIKKKYVIEQTWKRGVSAGYTDLFPIDEFARRIEDADRIHLVRGPKGRLYQARYRLTVAQTHATINYAEFREFNEVRGMLCGVLEFRFTNAKRNKVRAVLWDQKFLDEKDVVVATVARRSPVTLSEVIAGNQQKWAKQKLRPGQAEFRRKLDLVYGAHCCISGCGVMWVLEAAHIEPYKNASSNTTQNGLLLRSDLHGLFDSNQLAIDPASYLIYFSPEARSWPEYEQLHGKATLRPPQSEFHADAPTETALKKRWHKFVEEHEQC